MLLYQRSGSPTSICATLNPTYLPFTGTAPATSQLTGKNYGYSDQPVPFHGIIDASGTLNHNSGAIALNGILTDSNGVDANGQLVDDNSTSSAINQGTLGNDNSTGSYDYVQPFGQVQSGRGFSVFTWGFIRMGTDISDMPSSGTATFTGETVGDTNGVAGNGAPATVSANFGTGLLNASTSHTIAGVTEMVILNGMTLTGNDLSGGTLAITNNGSAVDGTSFGYATGGEFYGYDLLNGGPDELGIMISNAGTDANGNLTILSD